MSTPVVATLGQHDGVVQALHPAITAMHEEWDCELYAIHEASAGLAPCEVGALITFVMSEVAGFMTAGTSGRS